MTHETGRFGRALLAALVVAGAACERSAQRSADTMAAAPAPSDSTAPDSARSQWSVDPYGIGPVRAGMTLAELSGVTSETLRPAYDISESCAYVSPKALPNGVRVMVVDDSVGRIDVTEKGVLTKEGVGVGDLESQVLSLYGTRAHVEPHKYTGPTGHYVVVEPPGDSLHRIIFETDGKVVERYRAGRRPAVELVEGCA